MRGTTATSRIRVSWLARVMQYTPVPSKYGLPDPVLGVYRPAALELDAVLGYLLGHGVGHNLDALVDHPGAGGPAQGRVEFGQDVQEGFEQDYPDAVRVYVRVVGGKVLVDKGVYLRSYL